MRSLYGGTQLKLTSIPNGAPRSGGRVTHDDRTKRIIAAARTIFLKHGFDGASMDEVALNAGVSKRTVYNRFVSKEELFDEVARDACSQAFSFSVGTPEDAPIREYLTDLARCILESRLSRESIALLRNIAFRSPQMDSLASGYRTFGHDPVIEIASAYIHTQVEAGKLARCDAGEAAQTFFSLVREPLESQILFGLSDTVNLNANIPRHARRAVDTFLAIYAAA